MICYGLDKRVILITGGASGIGRATAILAAREGAAVAIADASAEAARETVELLNRDSHRAIAVALDVRDSAGCDAAVAAVEAQLGPIDGLVAAAGVSPPGLAATMEDEIWSRCIDINLSGLFWSLRAVGRRMIERRRGSIVALSSLDGMGGHAARAHYAASKHGVIGLVRALSIEWGQYGVRVNALAPGPVDTPLVAANVPPDHLEYAMRDRTPLGRLCRADEQAAPALFLLSDAASFVSGSVLTVDGALSAGWFTRWSGADLGSKRLMAEGVYRNPDDSR
ncbi:SDR family NAD(P)-dependent oxidoreductase [Paraburkholderia sediminicola]|uniref:SDR family NAD(P)-dependent oxidoreductase n=1 Tax=Paraburkholderia sediminicola TaxID=458836 RepID=UPI000E731837